jgi:hypothetical protein
MRAAEDVGFLMTDVEQKMGKDDGGNDAVYYVPGTSGISHAWSDQPFGIQLTFPIATSTVKTQNAVGGGINNSATDERVCAEFFIFRLRLSGLDYKSRSGRQESDGLEGANRGWRKPEESLDWHLWSSGKKPSMNDASLSAGAERNFNLSSVLANQVQSPGKLTFWMVLLPPHDSEIDCNRWKQWGEQAEAKLHVTLLRAEKLGGPGLDHGFGQ